MVEALAAARTLGWPLPALIAVLAAASTLAADLLAAAIDTSLRLAQTLLRHALTGRHP
ncbi:hypothetical protein [Streptomyces sp. SID8352]|uniref:hypothetical protein n=1 Tax=Streptomyces sp. SID8352 TaxID=2690338 RepID=UPI0013684350|nr:hypothetical protein [Streptomyces sp. SID8352]MYU24503.1 hypothetical protein [Streptomyces sp. SID8352]